MRLLFVYGPMEAARVGLEYALAYLHYGTHMTMLRRSQFDEGHVPVMGRHRSGD